MGFLVVCMNITFETQGKAHHIRVERSLFSGSDILS